MSSAAKRSAEEEAPRAWEWEKECAMAAAKRIIRERTGVISDAYQRYRLRKEGVDLKGFAGLVLEEVFRRISKRVHDLRLADPAASKIDLLRRISNLRHDRTFTSPMAKSATIDARRRLVGRGATKPEPQDDETIMERDQVRWSSSVRVEDPVERAGEEESMRQLLACFDDRNRKIIDLLLEGFSKGEIAERVGLNPTALSNRLARIRDRLQDRLSA